MCATRRVLCAFALGLLLATPVQAQVTTADLVGRVTDTSGGVLPGATVTLTNEGTRDVRVATTGEGGDYVFNLLPIGSYTVAVMGNYDPPAAEALADEIVEFLAAQN